MSVPVTFSVADRNNLQRKGRNGLFGLTAEVSSPSQQRGLGGRSWRQLVTSTVRGEEGCRSPLDDTPRGFVSMMIQVYNQGE